MKLSCSLPVEIQNYFMKKLTPLMIALCFLFSCDRYVDVEKAELQKIFSDLIAADSIKPGFYLIGSIDSWEVIEMTVSDTTYKRAAADIVKDGLWTYQLFGNAKVISEEEYRHMEKKLSKRPAYYRFSLPFLSKDKQSFYIYYTHDSLTVNATKQFRQYRMINNTWVMCELTYVGQPGQ
jgi:hypothetical protein